MPCAKDVTCVEDVSCAKDVPGDVPLPRGPVSAVKRTVVPADGTVLAAAGLARLGIDRPGCVFGTGEMLIAVGAGVLGRSAAGATAPPPHRGAAGAGRPPAHPARG